MKAALRKYNNFLAPQKELFGSTEITLHRKRKTVSLGDLFIKKKRRKYKSSRFMTVYLHYFAGP